ncbi:MAG: transposase [Betaproteobacteria bacterium]|nr:transposase [Betaproteobacteria bacterium]
MLSTPQNNCVSGREHAQFSTRRRLNSTNWCNIQAKYQHKVLRGEIIERVRTIVHQFFKEMGLTIAHGILSTNHVYMIVEIPSRIALVVFCNE